MARSSSLLDPQCIGRPRRLTTDQGVGADGASQLPRIQTTSTSSRRNADQPANHPTLPDLATGGPRSVRCRLRRAVSLALKQSPATGSGVGDYILPAGFSATPSHPGAGRPGLVAGSRPTVVSTVRSTPPEGRAIIRISEVDLQTVIHASQPGISPVAGGDPRLRRRGALHPVRGWGAEPSMFGRARLSRLVRVLPRPRSAPPAHLITILDQPALLTISAVVWPRSSRAPVYSTPASTTSRRLAREEMAARGHDSRR